MKHSALLLALLSALLVGCEQLSQATPAELESARTFAAAAIAFAPADGPAPSPGPSPGPGPGETCARCNGTGRIRPDNTIETECFDCGGDGIQSLDDLRAALAAARTQPAAQPTPPAVRAGCGC